MGSVTSGRPAPRFWAPTCAGTPQKVSSQMSHSAVGDLAGEAALPFHQLAQHEVGELAAAGEKEGLVAPAVPVTYVVEEPGGRQQGPLGR